MRVALLRMRYLPLAAFLGLSLLWGSGWLLRASTPAQPPLRSLAIQYAIAAVIPAALGPSPSSVAQATP